MFFFFFDFVEILREVYIFRQKRREDHVKLLELERCRIQVQGLEEFKVKMCEAHKELQKKLQEREQVAFWLPYHCFFLLLLSSN